MADFTVSRRAMLRRACALSALAAGMTAGAAAAQDLPVGGTVSVGAATIGSTGASTTVTQSTDRAVVNWQSFDVAAGKSVVFAQPNAQSATLNRVSGATTSTIAGQISANGSVYLVNPNGIAITASGSVQTGGGFVASTLDIADADFAAGKLAFTGTGASKAVSNAGTISAGQGAYVALLGGSVANGGTITVPLGKVALGSGESVALDLNGDGFMRVAVPTAALVGGNAALIEQAGSIAASGGRVELKAATVKDAVRNVINLSGNINADSATGSGGSIVLLGGDGGTVTVGGTLSARATGATGDGGFIETSGKTVDFTGITVDTRSLGGTTGNWLVDPDDLIVDAAAAANISTALASSNVTLQTTSTTASTTPGGLVTPTPGGLGDITVNSAITWASANTLTLASYHDIALNAAITATNATGQLTLTAGNDVAYAGAISASGAINVGIFNLTNGNWRQASALPAFAATDFRIALVKSSFLRVTGGNGSAGNPYVIADVYGLQGMASGAFLANSFTLAKSIDASGTATWNAGAGFVAIGTDGAGNVWNGSTFTPGGTTGFYTNFDGSGFTIDKLTISRGATVYQGLFGYTSNGAAMTNLGLTNVSITGGNFTGGLVGNSVVSIALVNDYATGTVTGANYVGGLAGNIDAGSIANSYSTVTVAGTGSLGGLVGVNGTGISDSYATGTVTGTQGTVGGLTGYNSGVLNRVYAMGNVTVNNGSAAGLNYAGGLIGRMAAGSVTDSHADGAVSVTGTGSFSNVGGLVGVANGTVSSSYATGSVTGLNLSNVGGLIGNTNGAVSGSTASGNVSGFTAVGGLVGLLGTGGTVTGGTATGTVNGNIYVGGLVGDMNTGSSVSGSSATTAVGTAAGTVTVTGTSSNVGGLVGRMVASSATTTSSITNSSASRNVQGVSQVGGLVGLMQAGAGGLATITGSSASGAVRATTTAGTAVGGLVGIQQVTGTSNARSEASITSSFATGNVTSAGQFAGGLVGYQNISNILGKVTIDRSYATGNVVGAVATSTTNNYFGGLVGYQLGTGGTIVGTLSITNSYASGKATGYQNIGGLVGSQYSRSTARATIAYSYATGAVSGFSQVGGLIGTQNNYGSALNAYATGQVTTNLAAGSNGPYFGGLIGLQGANNDIAQYVYATGAVTASGSSAVGGLIGSQTGTVTDAYATGFVTGASAVGGLIGTVNSTVARSFFDSYSTGQPSGAGTGSTVGITESAPTLRRPPPTPPTIRLPIPA